MGLFRHLGPNRHRMPRRNLLFQSLVYQPLLRHRQLAPELLTSNLYQKGSATAATLVFD